MAATATGLGGRHLVSPRAPTLTAHEAAVDSSSLGIGDLELDHYGLRFRDGKVEADYRRWYIDESIPFVRLGMVASAFGWLLILGALASLGYGGRSWSWIVLLMLPALAVAPLLTLRPRPDRGLLNATALTNALAGTLMVEMMLRIPRDRGAATGSACAVAFFAFMIFRLHPLRAALASGTYVTLLVIEFALAFQRDEIAAKTMWFGFVPALTSYSAGLFAAVALERVMRRAFHQEITIKRQTALLERERERSERLLTNVLPAAIATQLKERPGPIADHFPEVTVLFADVVGFTPLSAQLGPREVVNMLNTIFSRFDEIAREIGVEKIKTIGDAYMVVAGIPDERADHASAIAEMALRMVEALPAIAAEIGRDVQMRVGIATGPAVAGVIGTSKFSYDLWGDTVNTASRFESHGSAGTIQVGEATYERLRGSYVLEAIGLVDLKGKGPTPGWLLTGRA